MNRKAQSTIPLFTLIVMAMAFVIILGTFLFFFGTVNSAFQGGIIGGSVNITEASDDTFGKINSAFLFSADLIGIFFLFGLVIAIMLNGFMFREETPKFMITIDFIIIIFAYIISTYISNSYETILAALPFSDLIATNLNNSSMFVLFLPIITIVTGFITMILSYAGIPSRQSRLEVGGF